MMKLIRHYNPFHQKSPDTVVNVLLNTFRGLNRTLTLISDSLHFKRLLSGLNVYVKGICNLKHGDNCLYFMMDMFFFPKYIQKMRIMNYIVKFAGQI